MSGILATALIAAMLMVATTPLRALEPGVEASLPEDAFETVPRVGFRSLLELRLAAEPELFDNDGFAIQYLSFDVPGRSSACKETFIRLDDPASRATLVREARSRLRGALARLSRERPPSLLRITTRERLARYDPERELFRLEAIGGPRPTLLLKETSLTFAARGHCQLGFHARQEPGGEAASRLLEMRLRLDGDARLRGFPMPLLDARAFLYRQVVLRGTREVQVEAVIEIRVGADGLEGRVVQARVLEPGSGEPLHVFAPADPAWPPPTVEDDDAPSTSLVVQGPDMLGIRLGMAIAEAEDLVREHMAIGATFASGDHEARLFVADHIGEMIALHADPQDGTTVAGAWRVLLFRDDAPEPPVVAGRLEDKYGVPDWINAAGTGWAWGEGAQASLCRARRTAELALEAAEIRSGTVMEHVIDLLQAYRPVLALPEPALDEGDYAHCGPMVEARLVTGGLLTFLLDHRASAGAPEPPGSARPADAAATLLDLKL